MSKLIERLDGVLGLTYPFDDSDIAYEFSKAYPKLRAVVEAAQALHDNRLLPNMEIVVDSDCARLSDALAALEEDV